MKKEVSIFIFTFILGNFILSGCATLPKRSETSNLASQEQTAQLQNELQVKDQQIQDLQDRLQSSQTVALSSASKINSPKLSRKSKFVHVSGVSVEDVQKALAKAGFDPGPIDGQMGKKTKSAIKAFQRRNHLKADGIVGERTWSHLKS